MLFLVASEATKGATDVVKKVAKATKEELHNTNEMKTTVKKSVEKAKEATKNVARKTTAKREIKTSVYIEYMEKQVSVQDSIPRIKKVWQKAGNRIKDISDIKLYIKPEDNMIYFVINDDFSDSIEFE